MFVAFKKSTFEPPLTGMLQGFSRVILAALAAANVVACGSDTDAGDASPCSVAEQSGCKSGQVCENVSDGSVGCFAPVVVRGSVSELSTSGSALPSALVLARDVNGELRSQSVVSTDAKGRYELVVPATRAKDGTPSVPEFSLRADAQNFATFPSGLRVAPPVDVSNPVRTGDVWVIENDSTDIALSRLASTTGLGTLRGTVEAADPAGTLVVSGSASAVASRTGAFTLFNVPNGAAEVRGYNQGVQLEPAQVTVSAGTTLDGVVLRASDAPLADVSGSVSFVNAGANQTSVVLVVASTFNQNLARGEVPIGLRQSNVGGAYSFSGVPSGDYIVLAAFENDELVRDPDTAIGGTAIQHLTVAGDSVSVPGFKITGALDVMSPGATGPEIVEGAPTFRWADDSSEDGYEVSVYDTFGQRVYQNADVPRVTGSSDVSLAYAGPALTPGYYQFRAVSWRAGKGAALRTYISATEDLKGVFIVR